MIGSAPPADEPGPAPAPTPDAPPGAFVTVDRGTATCAAAIVGRVDGRWRLLASAAVSSAADPDVLVELLAERVRDADPDLAAGLGLDIGAPDRPSVAALPRLEALGGPQQHAVILAATEAALAQVSADAEAAGWRVSGASAQDHDPLAATRLATRPDVTALVIATSDAAGADERDLVGELIALASGIAERRPGLPIVLVGAAAAHTSAFPLGTEVVAVPRSHGDPSGDLRAILAARRGGPGDARQALVAVTGTLAALLGLRVELLEIGMSGALRVRAAPGGAAPGATVHVAAAEAPSAVLGLADDDAALDRVEGWATFGVDRARLRDRLAELRLVPWSDLGGDGALLRAAALRAALQRLVEATDAELGGPAPDLVILAGGAWSSIPAPAALLALADAIRRPGAVQVAFDPARLLAPLGTIDDAGEREGVVRDLLGDALVPLGTLAIARGVRGGRSVGRLRLAAAEGPVDLELAGGRLALVDLPPGQAATVELAFRAPVDLGVRGKRFAIRATGGLAGLVADLRDTPLRLPDRADERRDLLASWELALWPDRGR